MDDTLPASDPPEDDSPVKPVPPQERYRLGAELGRGGMGRVVEAFDIQLGRTVALKEVLPKGGRGTVRRFEREIQLTARLEHPSIVPIYDSGLTPDGRPYYVMRRVSGRPFDELVARARGLDERLTLLPPLLAAIDAVAHAHRRGVIHRDLKPQNILVGDLGETVVIDWGLAKVIGEEELPSGSGAPSAGDSLRTQVGSVFGTPGFMSPEQARGEELGTRGDVFALGATLYQLLAGTPPHHGTSATEVIDKTARQDVRPLSEVAPGSPAELVAIVEKALAFDPAKRYPNAGALGEDVRRFLDGQLVAAHHYTRRQHVARFARRHRAPLGVAALALVAVAVLAWVGVSRIIAARDTADQARATSETRRQEAEQARDALADRNDALVITQARALIDQNPTEAVAVLKTLSPGSRREPEARAIAQAAAMRGVAWALEGTPEITLSLELDREGRRLLRTTHDGSFRIWDLETHRLVLARTYAQNTRAMWVAGGRVLVIHPRSPPQLLDPVANTTESLVVDPIDVAVASDSGERVLFTTAAKGARLLDVPHRSVTELDAEHQIGDLAIAPDGTWIAILDRKSGVFVFDAAGKELARRDGPHARVAVSASRTLAVLADDGKVFEGKLADPPVWTELPLTLPPHRQVMDLIYRGQELDMWATTGEVLAWNGKRVFPLLPVDLLTGMMRVAGGDTLLVPSGDGKPVFLNDVVHGALHLPSVVPHHKLATSRGSNRLVVAGDGIVIAFDLASVVPRTLPVPPLTSAVFVDDRTLLAKHDGFDWYWMDAETGAMTSFTYDARGVPQIIAVDTASGRVLVHESSGPVERLVLLRRGSPETHVLAEGRATWGRLVSGDAIVYGVGDGRLFARIGTSEPREVTKLEGITQTVVPLGYRRFVAYSSTGEVARVDLTTDTIERTRIALGANGYLASDGANRIFIVDDRRLLAWDGAATELATFDKRIYRLDPYDGGLLVYLSDYEVQALELSPGAKPVRILAPSRQPAIQSYDRKVVVNLGAQQQLNVVELPSRARWTLPVLFDVKDTIDISPSTRRLIQSSTRHFVTWTLPQAEPDLAAWLEELTNASLDPGGVLAWPWQRPRAP